MRGSHTANHGRGDPSSAFRSQLVAVLAHLGLEGMLRLAERLADAPDGAVIVEERLAAESLAPRLRDAGLPRPDLTVRGPAFAASFDAWIGALAAVLSDLAQ